jgi:Ca2+-transporting ATPase
VRHQGAVELVLGMVGDGGRARTASRGAGGEGHRVIACAWRPLDEAAWAGGEPDRGFRLAGLLAFEDPVREGGGAIGPATRRASTPSW